MENITTIVKSKPPIDWYIEKLLKHPDFNIEEFINKLKQIEYEK